MSHILDVTGIRVGHATDTLRATGVTIVTADKAVAAGVSVLGGAPGTRETDALRPHNLGPPVDAVCLAGGSAFGLAAADGAMEALVSRGRGFEVAGHRVPIVPAAILFDLNGERPNYAALGAAAVEAAFAGEDRREGSIGAGTGATTATLKGGVGSASEALDRARVGAIVAVNAVGSATVANGPWLRAAPFARDGELGEPAPADADQAALFTKMRPAIAANTTIAVVATDMALSPAQLERFAASAHDGLTLSIYPAHTLFDGDTVFALSTARVAPPNTREHAMAMEAALRRAVARAAGRAVRFATKVPGMSVPTYAERFP